MVDIVIGPIQVPDLSNLDEGAATSAVENAYLLIQIQYAYTQDTPAGFVAVQNPAPLTEVEPNTTVFVTISLGVSQDAATIIPIRREKRIRWHDDQRDEDRERLRMAVMAAVEAEKMAAAMRAESEIAAPEPMFTSRQMMPVKFRGRK